MLQFPFLNNSEGPFTGAISGVYSTWVIDAEGKLVIAYDDGMVQTSQILDSQGLEYGVFSIFENGAERFGTYDIFVRGDSSFTFSSEYLQLQPASKYWNGEVNSWLTGTFDENGVRTPDHRFGLRFGLENTAANLDAMFYDFDGDENPDLIWCTTATQSYSISNNVLSLNRFNYARRDWYPIASTTIDGFRVFYVIEREERDASLWYGGLPGWFTYIPSRINIYREVDADDYTDFDFNVSGPCL